MSAQLPDKDVVARLRAGAPGYPNAGPDAGRTLAAARRALRRRRGRQAFGGAVVAVAVGLTAVGSITLPGSGAFDLPGGYGFSSLPNQGEPPVYTRQRMLDDIADLERQVLPVTEDLGVTLFIDDESLWGRPRCRVFTWSHGAFRDRHSDCANPDDPEPPFDAESDAAFTRMSGAIEHSGVNVYRVEKGGGGGPGTAFHLRDRSWRWNWYYSYVPGTPADAPAEVREETGLGVRRQVHVSGNWWFTVEPDD